MEVIMRLLVLKVGTVLLIGFAAFALSASNPDTDQKPVELKDMAQPEYDKDGRLLRPRGFEKWVVVGTSIGLGYLDGDKEPPKGPGIFHNVYLQPEAFDHFVSTGEFPDQTVFVVTNNEPLPAKTKGTVSRTGFVAATPSGLEVAVKDSKKYSDGWGYFLFDRKPDGLATALAQNKCYDCHAEHGAEDNVFTQFYSVLTDAREKRLGKGAATSRGKD
jgi:hypothetical protein